jgi:chromatin assembly factor 1 subunit B
MIFAVLTLKTVFLYDTQHVHPILKIGGLHLATLNDAAWSSDAKMLFIYFIIAL